MSVNETKLSQNTKTSPIKGRVFSIQRCSVHDGPGMRTVIYMKGCNLRCRWCHNPEGLDARPQILFHRAQCISCGLCAATCPEHHSIVNQTHRFSPEACLRCGRCADICPTDALELSGQEYRAEELLTIAMKDALYYHRSGGGVSFSGGECLLQTDFLEAVSVRLRENGIHVLIESALNLPWPIVARAAGFANSFFIDLKHMNTIVHKKYTGCDNRTILQNIRSLCRIHPDITLRTPLIPGVNDDDENLCASARFALEAGAQGLQLLRYNALAMGKYESAMAPYQSYGEQSQSVSQMDALCAQLNSFIHKSDYVFWRQ